MFICSLISLLDLCLKSFVTLCLAAVVVVVSARPRFLATPLEDVEFVNRRVYIPQVLHASSPVVVEHTAQILKPALASPNRRVYIPHHRITHQDGE